MKNMSVYVCVVKFKRPHMVTPVDMVVSEQRPHECHPGRYGTPPVFGFRTATHAHAVDGNIPVIVGMQAAYSEAEVERQGIVESQHVTAGNASAYQVSLLAGLRQLVIESAGLEHCAHISATLTAKVVAHLGSHFPQGITSVGIVPAP